MKLLSGIKRKVTISSIASLYDFNCFVLTVLVNLYEEPEKPANALEYPSLKTST